MNRQTKTIIDRIVVTHQDPSGIVAEVNGEVTHFQDREDLFRAAVLLAERSVEGKRVHPPPVKGE